MLKGISPHDTIELIAYANEEPPYFGTEQMGSAQHAQKLYTEQIGVKAMICLEMIGYFSDRENSQSYPAAGMGALYPDKGTSSPSSATGTASGWRGQSRKTCSPSCLPSA